MVFVKKSYEEIRDNVIAQITKGMVNEKKFRSISFYTYTGTEEELLTPRFV